MLGVAVNSAAVVIGVLLGLVLKKGISKKISDSVMTGVGLCVIFIGVGGLIPESNVQAVSLAAIVSVVLGSVAGTRADIDGRLCRLGHYISGKIGSKDGSASSVADGFVNASLLFCVGAMAIMGSISAGLEGDNTTLYIKSILDFTSSVMLTSTFGYGVVFSVIPLTLYQGAIAVGAGFLAPLLSQGAAEAISCTGSILITGLAFDLLGIAKIRVANYLPAIFFSPFLYYFFDWILGFVR